MRACFTNTLFQEEPLNTVSVIGLGVSLAINVRHCHTGEYLKMFTIVTDCCSAVNLEQRLDNPAESRIFGFLPFCSPHSSFHYPSTVQDPRRGANQFVLLLSSCSPSYASTLNYPIWRCETPSTPLPQTVAAHFLVLIKHATEIT